MAGDGLGFRSVRARLAPATVVLVASMMLLTVLTTFVGADMHDAITGRAKVSDEADATLGFDAEQRLNDVAIDGFGRVHVVWQDARSGQKNIMYSRSEDDGSSFGPNILVNGRYGSGDFIDPSIAVDGHGNPYVVWADPRNSGSTGVDIYMARSYDGGETFGPNVRVDSGSTNRVDSNPDIAVNAKGTISVAFVAGSGTAADIYLSVSEDGGRSFNPYQRIDDDTGTRRQINPVVALDSTDVSHVAWADARNNNLDIYYASRSAQGMVTYNIKVNDDTASAEQDQPAIALDGNVPVVVWKDDRNGNADIYLSQRTSPTAFGTNRLVNGDTTPTTNQLSPDIAIAPEAFTGQDPMFHVVWAAGQSGEYDIFLANSTDDGANFDTEVKVNSDALPSPARFNPSVSAMERGLPLAIVWEDGSDSARGMDVLASWRVPSDVHAQVKVTDDRPKAFEADPVTEVGDDGKLHAVWIDNRRGLHDVYYSRSSNAGRTWDADTRVNDDASGLHLTPDLVVGSDGTVHVVWTDYRNGSPQVRYANNKEKSSGFNPSIRVDDGTGDTFAVNPSVTMASNNSATVAWLDGRDGGARIRISYSVDGGGSWRPSMELAGSDGESLRSPPDLAARAGTIAVAFTDDKGGNHQAYLCYGPTVPGLGNPVAVEESPSGPVRGTVSVALDPLEGGNAFLVWCEEGNIKMSTFDPGDGSFGETSTPVAGTSYGPHIQPSIAVGPGGVVHLAWVDMDGSVPLAYLRAIVPGLDDPATSQLPSKSGQPASSPSVAFAAQQLSVVLVEDAVSDPDMICALWENSPPSAPVSQSPAKDGWVTEDQFNLTVSPGTDTDGDPVLVSFMALTPGGDRLARDWDINPRFHITDAAEGIYTWWAMTTDGYTLQSTERWNFTVDMTPMDAPVFHPLPDYTPGTNCTVSWDPVTDPGGGTVSYRVLASRNSEFTPPLLGDSGWITATNHTFEGLPATTIHYKLSARDAAGNTEEAPQTVSSTQDAEEPKVFIKVDPALEAEEGQEVTFNSSESTDDNGIAMYEWDFDSDGTVDSTEMVTTWTYDEAGSYRITIVVTDVAGNEAEYSDYTISIVDITPPSIFVEVDPGTEFNEGTTATFDASKTTDASGVEVIRWYVDNDDTPFATGDVVQIPFPTPGEYDVRAQALDVYHNSANQTMTINVLDVTPPEVSFGDIGPFDNTKVEFFTLFVNVTDSGGVATVMLHYKTQEQGTFDDVPMSRVGGSGSEWFKDELAPGGKGNATYYIVATDAAGNSNKTDYQRIQVVGVTDPTPSNGGGGDDGFDLMANWWILLIIVLIIVVALLVVGASRRGKQKEVVERKEPDTKPVQAPTPAAVAEESKPAKDRALCAIEEVYFIHNDGRLILAASSSTSADRDAQDIFAGMFTAIQDFIKDSMSRDGDLGSFDYGDNRIIIERGHYITCAATIYGTEPANMRNEVSEVVRRVEGNYAGVIERWDGDKSKLGGINEFAKRILALTGGVDRETVKKSREKKGVKLLSEVEFFQGFVRLKAAVKNDTDTVVTDAALDIVYDDNVLRIDHIQPVYEYKRGKVHLGNINSSEKKTVAFNFDPIICMESNIDGTLTYRDVGGKLQVVSMKTRRADIVCPIFFTRENANTAMLKRLINEELASKDSKVFRYPDGLAPNQAFELCKGVVHLHDVKFVREFIEEKPTWLGEAWFYGETKVKGYKIVIRVTVREDSHTAEFFTASQEMEVITGLLAEMGHSLNRMLKEKYMGRLKAQPIVDQRLKKNITDQPLLLEREE